MTSYLNFLLAPIAAQLQIYNGATQASCITFTYTQIIISIGQGMDSHK